MATILVATMSVFIIPQIIGDETVLADDTVINSVVIDNVTLPKKNEHPTTSGITSNGETAGFEVVRYQWVLDAGNQNIYGDDEYEPGKLYRLFIYLKSLDTYAFPNDIKTDVSLTVNGKSYTSSDSYEADTACLWGDSENLYISFYCKVTGDTFAVSYDSNGGSGEMAGTTVGENEELTLPECSFNPPNANKEFSKWQIGSTYYLPGEKVTVTSAINAKAIWADVKSFNLSYNLNGHGTSAPSPKELPRNSFVAMYLPIMQNDGDWIFDGWYTDKATTKPVDSGLRLTDDLELYARWYTEITNVNISDVSMPVIGEYPKFDGVTSDGSTKGYTIDSLCWVHTSSNSIVTEEESFVAGELYNLYIVLKPSESHKFPVNVKNDIAFSFNGTSYASSDSYEAGTVCLWSNDVDLYISVFSYATVKTYDVVFDSNSGSSVATQKVEEGSKATKPVDPTRSGYSFYGWYTDPECTSAFDFDSTVNADVTLYAKWKEVPATPTEPAIPTPTTPVTPAPESSGKTFEDFVERLYTVALNRPSEPEGKAFWCEHVGNGDLNGAQCANEFLLSKEFNDRKLTDEQFLEVLYKTFFDREAKDDKDGFNFWMNCLKTQGRDSVVDCFINSEEWCNVCASFGVKSGATRAKATVASKNATAFATRLYTECLGRDPEEGGLKFWSLGLTNLELTGKQAAHEFFFSKEFNDHNYSNEELLTRMYTTFMGRKPDTDGMNYWLGEMKNGMTKEDVFNEFVKSAEFTQICKDYAIDRG